MWSYVSRGIFRTRSNIYDGAFITSFKTYFKNVPNSIELPLGSIFLHSSFFREKTKNYENVERKSLFLTMEHFFFEVWNYIVNCITLHSFFPHPFLCLVTKMNLPLSSFDPRKQLFLCLHLVQQILLNLIGASEFFFHNQLETNNFAE